MKKMKTRIIWTKIYEDTWFCSLDLNERFLFIYFFSNQRIGHTGIYELPERVVLFETQITKKYYSQVKTKFQSAKKIYFYKDWLYVPNASIYGGYKGEKNKTAYNKEKKNIPINVLNTLINKKRALE